LAFSSHRGMHGNENGGVTIESLIIKESKVDGVVLNGASNVLLQNSGIGHR